MVVSSCECHCDLGVGKKANIEVTGGGEEMLLSMVRLCGMEVPPSTGLDISRSLPLNISFLLKDEQKDLKSHSCIANVRS